MVISIYRGDTKSMTALCIAVCKLLPQYSPKDIEGVIQKAQDGEIITAAEAAVRVTELLSAVMIQCPAISPRCPEKAFDPIARINALLIRRSAPHANCREVYEAVNRCRENKEEAERKSC